MWTKTQRNFPQGLFHLPWKCSAVCVAWRRYYQACFRVSERYLVSPCAHYNMWQLEVQVRLLCWCFWNCHGIFLGGNLGTFLPEAACGNFSFPRGILKLFWFVFGVWWPLAHLNKSLMERVRVTFLIELEFFLAVARPGGCWYLEGGSLSFCQWPGMFSAGLDLWLQLWAVTGTFSVLP
jgi:hypothetical protein